MKSILLTAFTSLCLFVSGQRLHVNLHVGTANYVGELFFLKGKLPEYDLKNAKLALGLGLEYELMRKLSVRGIFTYGKINADDKRSGIDASRNLNFTTSIWDLMIAGQYYIIDPDRYLLSPYLFTGVSFFHFNPYTYDRSGNKVYLQPLSTEGQGFVEGREPYKLYQAAIPYGAGLKFSASENVRIGVEISCRKTFTDYLDDVSTTYVDRELLLQHRGQTAVDVAYRGNEVTPHANYPDAGTERGIARFKDRYYFSTVTVSFRLNNGGGGGRRGSSLSCPGRM